MAIFTAATIGWFILGAVATGILVSFWDDIRNWLNRFAANFIEKQFGYAAREKMQRAIVKIDRVMDRVRNHSTIYVKENPLDTHFLKTEVVAETKAYNIDSKILEEIKQNNRLVKEFEYNSGI